MGRASYVFSITELILQDGKGVVSRGRHGVYVDVVGIMERFHVSKSTAYAVRELVLRRLEEGKETRLPEKQDTNLQSRDPEFYKAMFGDGASSEEQEQGSDVSSE